MKRIFLVFLLWLPLISHAEWKRVTYSDDGSVVAYFDPDRIKRNGTGDMSPVAWILVNYNKPQKDKTTGGKSYQSVLRKTMYDCKYEKTAYLQAVWYAQKVAHGDVIDSVESNDYAWDSIVPNSMGEDELRFICKQ